MPFKLIEATTRATAGLRLLGKDVCFVIAAVAAPLVIFATEAGATTELVLQIDSSWRYDSNPLRFTEDADVQAILATGGKSDTLQANDLRVELVQPLDSPETRLVFVAQLGNRNYRQMSQLDNIEYAYRMAFEWRLGDLWTGKLLHMQEQQLYDYLNGALTTRDMLHRTTSSADLVLQVSPTIQIPLALRIQRSQYDTLANSVFDYHERDVDVGVRFLNGGGSNINFGLRSAEVSFPQRTGAILTSLDSGYLDSEIYFASDWQYSALTRFSTRISEMQRRYATLNSRDFSATTAELRILHNYSPKTVLGVSFWSRPYGITDSTALYTMNTGTQIDASWRASEKTRLMLYTRKERQRYQYVDLTQGHLSTEFDQRRAGGSIGYTASPDVQLYVAGFRDQVDPSNSGVRIFQNTLRVGIEYTFENISGLAQRDGFRLPKK